MITILLIIVLVALLIGFVPTPGAPTYTPYYGSTYQPIGLIGLVIVIILFLFLLGIVPHRNLW